jgi:histidinol phosphatase-like PHP family hydrolase
MFKYETHLHTDETSPCGRVPAAEAVRIYKEAGYTGIVVTDHYFHGFFERLLFKNWEKKIDLYLTGYRNAVDEGARAGLDVHLGMEIQFNENQNDYLVYGFDEQFLRTEQKLYKLGLEGFRKLTAGSGIVIVQAHPFRPRMVPARPSLIDGVEIYNGNPRHDSSNHLALEYARENGLKMLSGSDFHQVQDAARGGIIVDKRIKPGSFARMLIESDHIECIKTE